MSGEDARLYKTHWATQGQAISIRQSVKCHQMFINLRVAPVNVHQTRRLIYLDQMLLLRLMVEWSYELCVLYLSTLLFIRLSDAALIKLINDGITADKRRGGVLVRNDWNLSGIVLMAFHLSDCFQASGPPVQNEPVDLSVRVVAPVAAQVIVNGGKSIGIALSWYD